MEKPFDTHAHYYDSRFDEWPGGAEALLEALLPTLSGVVNVGTDLENARTATEQAARYPAMYAAVGIHPTDGEKYPDPAAAVRELADFLGTREACAARKIVALGEIGLDYHAPDADRARQAALFSAQLELAASLDLPVIVHDREAHGDCFEAVCRVPRARGIFHSYSGSAEMARELLRRGWYLSFSGVVTFRNAPRVREAAAAVPLDRLLIETDCPYLAPHPHRGEINHSGYLSLTAAALAEVKGVSTDRLIAQTRENAKRLFGIS